MFEIMTKKFAFQSTKLSEMVRSAELALRMLISRLADRGLVSIESTDHIVTRLMARESMGPTGFAFGAAIPHANVPGIEAPVGIIGHSESGILWGAHDGGVITVNWICLILCPQSGQRGDEFVDMLEVAAREISAQQRAFLESGFMAGDP